MLPGSVSGTVQGWRTEVRVNGVLRSIESVSWSSEMAGDMPDQVIASGGLGGASGTINWAPQTAVQARPVSPWAKVANWPPSPGDLVQVRVSDGVTWWNRFTGVIDKTTGGTTGHQSTVRDFSDRITGRFSHEALLRYMPPFIEDGDYRSIGLNFWYPLTSALRSAGFCNVPKIEGPSALSVPLQGSVWAEAGTVRDAGGNPGAHASFFAAEYGYAAGNFTAAYLPRLDESTSTPVQATVVIPGTHSGVAAVDISYGARTIRLRVNNSRAVTAFFSPNGTSPWTTVASVGGSSAGVTTVVQLLIKGGAWTLRTSNGETGTGSQSLGTGVMSLVQVNADADARIAGVQVSHPQSTVREFASIGFKPNMRFQASGLASTMDMMPALKGRSISDLFNEITAATLTAAWWDESGTLILRPSDSLRGTDPSWTYNTTMDVTSIGWEDSLQAVRSAVNVKWLDPSITKGKQYRIELWRGATDVLIDSDSKEKFVEPDSGTEWFGVDRTLRRLNASSWGAYNLRRGSYCGVWLSDSDGAPDSRSASVDIASENMYSDTMKITTTVNSLPAGTEINTATHPEATALRAYLRAQPLPVVRGMGRGEWVDATYTATGAANSSAPVLEHDLGYWGQEYFTAPDSVAKRIGDYLAGMVKTPQPTITDLGVMYDPRRQVGDVYTLRSEWIGIELRCLVTAINEDHGGGSHQSLTVRVISATNIRGVSYDDLAAAWGPSNYAGLQAAWSALNYTALAADPLEGAPA